MSSGYTRSYLECRRRRRWPKILSPCPQPQAQMVLSTPALALLVAPLTLVLVPPARACLVAWGLLTAPLVLAFLAPPALVPLAWPLPLRAP